MKTEKISLGADLQNKFTAYLQVAATRRRIKYMGTLKKRNESEISVENVWEQSMLTEDIDFLLRLPLGDQMENQRLARIISELSQQEYQILCLRVIAGLKFSEIADVLGLGLFTVKNRYRSIAKRLRSGGRDTYDGKL